MALTGFDKYGIESLSPTMIANWDAAPATLILRRVFGVRGESNANMWRGDAVEAGFADYLRYSKLDQAQAVADDAFLVRCDGVLDEVAEKARGLVPDMVARLAEFADSEWECREVLATQLVVEKLYPSPNIPIRGKMDFAFMDGSNIELKTTTRAPSVVENASLSHRWQAAFYADARQQTVHLTYATAKKVVSFPVHPGDPVLAGALNTARAMERMLGAHDEGLDLLSSLPTTADSFYWDDVLIQSYQSAIDGDLLPLKGTGTEALIEKGIITFGKHAGRHISEVPDKYLDWLLDPQLSSGGTFDVPEALQKVIRKHREAA